MSAPSSISGQSRFRIIVENLDIARRLLDRREQAPPAGRSASERQSGLSRLALDLAEDLEGSFVAELVEAFESRPGAMALRGGTGRGRRSRNGPALPDGFLVRGFALSLPVLAAARAHGRNLDDPSRSGEVASLLARTGLWFLGRTSVPDPASLAIGSSRGADLESACRIVGLWIGRLALAGSIPTSLGRILGHGVDYFALWTAGAVADRFYDDLELTLEESMEVVRLAQDFQLALVTALVRTARADGRLSYEEQELLGSSLEGLAFSGEEREACLSQARADGAGPAADILAAVEIPAHRDFIIARAVEMAFADRRETREEKAVLRQLAALLGVDESAVRARESQARELNRIMGMEA